MQFNYYFSPTRETLEADVRRFVDFLVAHGAESVTNLKISCYPWRNGKRLQAVNANGVIRPVCFEIEPNDPRYEAPQFDAQHEALTIRERPDDLGHFGLATAFDHDD